MQRFSFAAGFAITLGLSGAALAEPVGLTPDMMSVTVETFNGPVEIMREQDNANRLEGDWTLTSRPCPLFCIQPMGPAEGVTPVGELEVLAALQDPGLGLRVSPQHKIYAPAPPLGAGPRVLLDAAREVLLRLAGVPG